MEKEFTRFVAEPVKPGKVDFQTAKQPKKRIRFSKIFYIGIFTVLLCVGVVTYYYLQTKNPKEEKSLSVNTQKLIEKVSKLIILPIGEDPTIATVSDPEKVRNQPFFANAKTGDQLLIYLKSRKAFLYRPSENKLVEVAPLSPENSSINDAL